jgi:hypothetical protein
MRQNMAFMAALALTISLGGNAAAGGVQEPDRAVSLSEVALCRSIAADAARLACFDRAVAALDAAERAGDVVVLDRAQVRETNRQLFGFEIANPFAGRPNVAPEAALDAVETTLTSAGSSGEGKWIFRLANGSEWRQIDSGAVQFRNREGEAVRVRRASLGSYLMTIGNSRAVRVRRQ